MGLLAKIQAKLFGSKLQTKTTSSSNLLQLWSPNFVRNEDPTLNTTFISCVNVFASHFEKITLGAYLYDTPTKNKKYINKLLSLQPNPLQTAAQFWKSVATSYARDNLAIIYLEWDYENIKEPLKALWLIDLEKNSVKITEKNKKIYMSFRLDNQNVETDTDELIILTRECDPSSLLGKLSPALAQSVRALSTIYEGTERAIIQSAYIRFIVSTSMPMKDEAKKERAEQFKENFLNPTNSYGVIFTDSSQQITPVDSSKGIVTHSLDIKEYKQDILNYMRTSLNMLNGDYTDVQFQAYYDTNIEPLVVELQQALTSKLFTQDEINKGNNIKIQTSRIQSMSIQTRLQIVQTALKIPIVKPNDMLDLLYLPPLENGDKEMATLNYVNSNKQDEYQGVDEENTKEKANV